VHGVLPALLALAERLLGLRDVHLQRVGGSSRFSFTCCAQEPPLRRIVPPRARPARRGSRPTVPSSLHPRQTSCHAAPAPLWPADAQSNRTAPAEREGPGGAATFRAGPRCSTNARIPINWPTAALFIAVACYHAQVKANPAQTPRTWLSATLC
jgi:hypothetical protein